MSLAFDEVPGGVKAPPGSTRRLPILGLLALVALAPALVAWVGDPGDGTPPGDGAVRTLVLDIRFSKFSESSISVRPGETVRIVVRNHDPIPHELIVGDMAVQERHENGTEAYHGEVPGEVTIPQNGVAETTYTFPARPTQPILFGCHLPGHWDYGMQGAIRFS